MALNLYNIGLFKSRYKNWVNPVHIVLGGGCSGDARLVRGQLCCQTRPHLSIVAPLTASATLRP